MSGRIRIGFLLAAAVTLALPAIAQGPPAPAATLRGTVQDVSGALMRAVRVRIFEGAASLADDRDPIREANTDSDGRFAFALPDGEYRVEIFAPDFTVYNEPLTLGPGTGPLDVVLDLDMIQFAVDVIPTEQLIADATTSLTSTRLSGDDLLGLPDNEEDLATYLMLLAGADITGDLEEDVLANFIIDGFDDGRLPSPDQISQIIIDPNSLNADGGGPRIEIVTRPGTGRWRRRVNFNFADEALNALTPGETRKEPRQTRDARFEISGPVVPGVMEVDFEYSTSTDERAGNSLRAITPTGSMFLGVVRPERDEDFEVETEFEISPNHSLDVGFSYSTGRATNGGVGGFTLPQRAYEDETTDWRFVVSERMFGDAFTNDIQFQLRRDNRTRTPVNTGFAIDVADAFRTGGGTSRSSENRTTVQIDNRLRWERGDWNFQWRGEIEYQADLGVDQDNYNGTFDFASLHDYCYATGFAGVNCQETQQIVDDANAGGATPVYTDARGREVEITGLPTTFTQASGNAELQFNELAYDTSFQADRGFGERASLRLGVRYQGTNHSIRHLRLNPTLNGQYRLTENTVISAGAQVNFQDFGDTERLLRNDGSTYQSELTISNPSFPDPFDGGTIEITEETASLWVLDPDYQAPYSINPQVSVTQQVPGNIRLNVSYSTGFGVHQRRTRNINAPWPGTPLPDSIRDLPSDERREAIDQMRPYYPIVGNITQIESSGRSSSSNLRFRVQPRGNFDFLGLQLSGNFDYNYRRASNDNDFNNPYIREWGPARRSHEVRSQFRIRTPRESAGEGFLHRLAAVTYLGTNFNFNFRASTGNLYSINSGTDLNGDQSRRDRPPGVVRNTETGPGSWNLDMTFTRELRFGGGDGAGDSAGFASPSPEQRVRLQARFNNLLNHSQPRAYSGVLTSPLFGQPTGYSGGRTVSLSMNLDF